MERGRLLAGNAAMKHDLSTLDYLIEDVGGCQAAARLLGVHHSTVYRWRARRAVPPKACIRALQAASSWGRQDRAIMTRAHRQVLEDSLAVQRAEIARLEALVEHLVKTSDFGCANAPIWRMARVY